MSADVLVTGPQRSGTTLVCSLLNRLPDAVALDEPVPVGFFGQPDLGDRLERFIAGQRASLVAEGRARSWVSDDESNHVADATGWWNAPLAWVPGAIGDRLWKRFAGRPSPAHLGWLELDGPMTEPFTLVVKQLAAVTAALPDLVDRFECVAIVRNPLATLASWNTVDFKRAGRAPFAEKVDPSLGERLDRARNRYDRQVSLLSWFFERFATTMPRRRVIRYEDVCDDPATTLSVITPSAASLEGALKSRNDNVIYDPKLIAKLSSRVLQSDGAFWEYYERADVERVAASFVPAATR